MFEIENNKVESYLFKKAVLYIKIITIVDEVKKHFEDIIPLAKFHGKILMVD